MNRLSKRSLAIALCVIAASAISMLAVTQDLEGMAREVKALLDAESLACQFSGTVLLAYEGVPFFAAGYGLADREQGLPNGVDTKFNLGSMDKMFTAVAILQLVEAGLIDMDAPIGTYLPDYPNRDAAELVTVRHLLAHKGGFGSYFGHPEYLDVFDEIRSLDDYAALVMDEELLFEPGTQSGYSNSGFIVLGMIIEAVSGQSYYDYVLENIHRPSGMVNTNCYEWDTCVTNLAIGYTTRDEDDEETGVISRNEFALPTKGGPGGGGYSTAPDLLAFANALLGYELLSEATTVDMLEAKTQLAPGFGYAYGFFDRIVEGHRMVGHGGSFPGICSMLSIYPDLGYTVIILTNTDHGCVVAREAVNGVLLP